MAILAESAVATNATIDTGFNRVATTITAAFTRFRLLRIDVESVRHPYGGFDVASLVCSDSLSLTVEREVPVTKPKARKDRYIRVCWCSS